MKEKTLKEIVEEIKNKGIETKECLKISTNVKIAENTFIPIMGELEITDKEVRIVEYPIFKMWSENTICVFTKIYSLSFEQE